MKHEKTKIVDKILRVIHSQATSMFSGNLKSVILYGSYARGDYQNDSDIDVMVLVDMDKHDLMCYEKKIAHLSSKIDLDYDVFTSIKLQDYKTYNDWLNVVPFYQNVQREGVFVNG